MIFFLDHLKYSFQLFNENKKIDKIHFLIFFVLNYMYIVLKIKTALFSQGMFASWIPEISDILGRRQKYGGCYKKERGKK